MRFRHVRPALATAVAAAALVVPSAFAQTAPTSAVPFRIVGEYVTIYDLSSPVTVRVDDLRAALDHVRAGGDRATAQARLDALPQALRYAVGWELTHGVEQAGTEDARPPEEDVDRAAGGDAEPPVEAEDPVTTVNNAESANYTAPSVNCTYYSARDKRQMNSAIFRLTLYKFHMYAPWRGCDNGTNYGEDEDLDATYSDLDPFFTCTENESMPSKSAGPYGAPWVRFRVSGECYQRIVIDGKEWAAGKNRPFIDNEYDWAGKRTLRTGSAH